MQNFAAWALVALLPYVQAQVPAYGQCESTDVVLIILTAPIET